MTLKNKFNKWRWKITKNGYILDRLIFNIFFFVIMAFLFSVLVSYNFDFSVQIYYKCDQDLPCENPFYKGIIHSSNPVYDLDNICTYDWCDEEYLPGGFEFGKKPSTSLKYAWLVALILCTSALVTNHFIHNKDFDLKWPELEE